MNYTIDQIEDAIIQELRKSPMEGYCTIDTFGGPLAANSVKEFMAGKNAPACYVFYRDGNWEDDGTTKVMQFAAIVIARNLRGGGAARKGGGPSEVGAYDMLEDVKAALKGKSLGLDIGPIKPKRETNIGADSHTAIYAIEFETYFHEELTL